MSHRNRNNSSRSINEADQNHQDKRNWQENLGRNSRDLVTRNKSCQQKKQLRSLSLPPFVGAYYIGTLNAVDNRHPHLNRNSRSSSRNKENQPIRSTSQPPNRTKTNMNPDSKESSLLTKSQDQSNKNSFRTKSKLVNDHVPQATAERIEMRYRQRLNNARLIVRESPKKENKSTLSFSSSKNVRNKGVPLSQSKSPHLINTQESKTHASASLAQNCYVYPKIKRMNTFDFLASSSRSRLPIKRQHAISNCTIPKYKPHSKSSEEENNPRDLYAGFRSLSKIPIPNNSSRQTSKTKFESLQKPYMECKKSFIPVGINGSKTDSKTIVSSKLDSLNMQEPSNVSISTETFIDNEHRDENMNPPEDASKRLQIKYNLEFISSPLVTEEIQSNDHFSNSAQNNSPITFISKSDAPIRPDVYDVSMPPEMFASNNSSKKDLYVTEEESLSFPQKNIFDLLPLSLDIKSRETEDSSPMSASEFSKFDPSEPSPSSSKLNSSPFLPQSGDIPRHEYLDSSNISEIITTHEDLKNQQNLLVECKMDLEESKDIQKEEDFETLAPRLVADPIEIEDFKLIHKTIMPQSPNLTETESENVKVPFLNDTKDSQTNENRYVEYIIAESEIKEFFQECVTSEKLPVEIVTKSSIQTEETEDILWMDEKNESNHQIVLQETVSDTQFSDNESNSIEEDSLELNCTIIGKMEPAEVMVNNSKYKGTLETAKEKQNMNQIEDIITNEYSSKPIIVNECSSEPIITNEYPSETKVTIEYSSEPIITNEYSSEPIIINEYSSEPIVTNEYSSEPIITTEYSSEPIVTTEYSSEPIVTTEYSSEPIITNEYSTATDYTNGRTTSEYISLEQVEVEEAAVRAENSFETSLETDQSLEDTCEAVLNSAEKPTEQMSAMFMKESIEIRPEGNLKMTYTDLDNFNDTSFKSSLSSFSNESQEDIDITVAFVNQKQGFKRFTKIRKKLQAIFTSSVDKTKYSASDLVAENTNDIVVGENIKELSTEEIFPGEISLVGLISKDILHNDSEEKTSDHNSVYEQEDQIKVPFAESTNDKNEVEIKSSEYFPETCDRLVVTTFNESDIGTEEVENTDTADIKEKKSGELARATEINQTLSRGEIMTGEENELTFVLTGKDIEEVTKEEECSVASKIEEVIENTVTTPDLAKNNEESPFSRFFNKLFSKRDPEVIIDLNRSNNQEAETDMSSPLENRHVFESCISTDPMDHVEAVSNVQEDTPEADPTILNLPQTIQIDEGYEIDVNDIKKWTPKNDYFHPNSDHENNKLDFDSETEIQGEISTENRLSPITKSEDIMVVLDSEPKISEYSGLQISNNLDTIPTGNISTDFQKNLHDFENLTDDLKESDNVPVEFKIVDCVIKEESTEELNELRCADKFSQIKTDSEIKEFFHDCVTSERLVENNEMGKELPENQLNYTETSEMFISRNEELKDGDPGIKTSSKDSDSSGNQGVRPEIEILPEEKPEIEENLPENQLNYSERSEIMISRTEKFKDENPRIQILSKDYESKELETEEYLPQNQLNYSETSEMIPFTTEEINDENSAIQTLSKDVDYSGDQEIRTKGEILFEQIPHMEENLNENQKSSGIIISRTEEIKYEDQGIETLSKESDSSVDQEIRTEAELLPLDDDHDDVKSSEEKLPEVNPEEESKTDLKTEANETRNKTLATIKKPLLSFVPKLKRAFTFKSDKKDLQSSNTLDSENNVNSDVKVIESTKEPLMTTEKVGHSSDMTIQEKFLQPSLAVNDDVEAVILPEVPLEITGTEAVLSEPKNLGSHTLELAKIETDELVTDNYEDNSIIETICETEMQKEELNTETIPNAKEKEYENEDIFYFEPDLAADNIESQDVSGPTITNEEHSEKLNARQEIDARKSRSWYEKMKDFFGSKKSKDGSFDEMFSGDSTFRRSESYHTKQLDSDVASGSYGSTHWSDIVDENVVATLTNDMLEEESESKELKSNEPNKNLIDPDTAIFPVNNYNENESNPPGQNAIAEGSVPDQKSDINDSEDQSIQMIFSTDNPDSKITFIDQVDKFNSMEESDQTSSVNLATELVQSIQTNDDVNLNYSLPEKENCDRHWKKISVGSVPLNIKKHRMIQSITSLGSCPPDEVHQDLDSLNECQNIEAEQQMDQINPESDLTELLTIHKIEEPENMVEKQTISERIPVEETHSVMDEITQVMVSESYENALLQVFTYLDHKTLSVTSQICKLWRSISYNPSLWQHVVFSHGRMTSKFLERFSDRCSQLKTLILENIQGRPKRRGESERFYQEEMRASLEPGLESILIKAEGNLQKLSFINCGPVITERCLWLVSCYARVLQNLTYRSATDPPSAEVLWALASGCRDITHLNLSPDNPRSPQQERFNNKCAHLIAKNYPRLKSISVGGSGIDDVGLLIIAEKCQQLERLELYNFIHKIIESSAENMCTSGLQKLQELYFVHTAVDAKIIPLFARNCPNLKKIKIQVDIQDYFGDILQPKDRRKYKLIGLKLKSLKSQSKLDQILELDFKDCK